VSDPAERLVISPIARRSKLSDHVVEALSRLVVEGELPPGSIIHTEALGKKLGVSRTPMREALQRLEADGFVTIAANGIAKVARLEGDEALELMELREVVDGLACRVLAERGTTASIYDELSHLVASAEKAALADDKHGWPRLNARFHIAILAATNHRPLQQFQPLVRLTSQAVYLRQGEQSLRHRQSSQEHADILQAIKDGNPIEAETLARRHVRHAMRFWLNSGHKRRSMAVDE